MYLWSSLTPEAVLSSVDNGSFSSLTSLGLKSTRAIGNLVWKQGLPVSLLEQAQRVGGDERLCVVPATKSEDEVTKARKESFIKKQKQNKTNKTTKNETALSRIWRHNRWTHSLNRFTSPWPRDTHCLWALSAGRHSTPVHCTGQSGGRLPTEGGEGYMWALLPLLLSGSQASASIVGHFLSGWGCQDKSELTWSQ